MKNWFIGFCSMFLLAASALAAVNINTATEDQLVTLSGIGPGKAKAIIEYRKTTPFKTVEDITKVPGIKTSSYNKIKGEITVNGGNVATAKAPVAAVKPPKK